ncbi:MAG: hypothetical protein AUH81_09895 [Candidatus Rokubacteria bacterium 13_1_40CM_4_69_5]|nr:MAG: hypothetical protein AUH81_09895 [Candidatus Rokubacteria bacterium 13_1_40CM_4_69_5]OLE39737.1 MAG: hypothetical protein AUG00_00820 [Candidatus Rokubacteria bacterium 13_1_20CM_2_70_7]
MKGASNGLQESFQLFQAPSEDGPLRVQHFVLCTEHADCMAQRGEIGPELLTFLAGRVGSRSHPLMLLEQSRNDIAQQDLALVSPAIKPPLRLHSSDVRIRVWRLSGPGSGGAFTCRPTSCCLRMYRNHEAGAGVQILPELQRTATITPAPVRLVRPSALPALSLPPIGDDQYRLVIGEAFSGGSQDVGPITCHDEQICG